MIIPDLQETLFRLETKEFLENVNIPVAVFSKWYKDGFLSFDLSLKEDISYPEELELRFILGLFNSGLSVGSIHELLTNLSKPYSYHSQKVYFDMFDSKWKYLPKMEDRDEKEILVEYIKTTDDAEELRGMISTIEQKLSDLD